MQSTASTTVRAKDWAHYLYLHRDERPRKSDLAVRIGVSNADFSKLLDPRRYNPAVSDATAAAIAELWNQSIDYVRRIYPRRKEVAV